MLTDRNEGYLNGRRCGSHSGGVGAFCSRLSRAAIARNDGIRTYGMLRYGGALSVWLGAANFSFERYRQPRTCGQGNRLSIHTSELIFYSYFPK